MWSDELSAWHVLWTLLIRQKIQEAASQHSAQLEAATLRSQELSALHQEAEARCSALKLAAVAKEEACAALEVQLEARAAASRAESVAHRFKVSSSSGSNSRGCCTVVEWLAQHPG